jgi:hypothetical protein
MMLTAARRDIALDQGSGLWAGIRRCWRHRRRVVAARFGLMFVNARTGVEEDQAACRLGSLH